MDEQFILVFHAKAKRWDEMKSRKIEERVHVWNRVYKSVHVIAHTHTHT